MKNAVQHHRTRAETQEDAIRGHQPLCCMRRGMAVQQAVPRLLGGGMWHVDVKCGRCVSAFFEIARFKPYGPGDKVVFPGDDYDSEGTVESVYGEQGTRRRWLVISRHEWYSPRRYSLRKGGAWVRVGKVKSDNDVAIIR